MNEHKSAVRELMCNRAGLLVDNFVGLVQETFGQFGIKALYDELEKAHAKATAPSYTGDRRNLHKLFCVNDWKELIQHIGNGVFGVSPDDYFYMPIHVSEAKVGGVEYESVDIDCAKVVVTHVFNSKVVFNFDDVLLYGAMSSENTNKGGFAKTALCKYLNEHFIKVFAGAEDYLDKNNDGNKISLPTRFEVFGEGPKECNWESGLYPIRETLDFTQLDFFKSIKNRIRCKGNDTTWSWLSSPHASNTASFCYVDSSGSADGNYASYTIGVSPCFCLSANLKLPPHCGADARGGESV
jgi:hypothetical protein